MVQVFQTFTGQNIFSKKNFNPKQIWLGTYFLGITSDVLYTLYTKYKADSTYWIMTQHCELNELYIFKSKTEKKH